MIFDEFRAKKSLGQNFILDMGFLKSLVDKLDLSKNDTVIEIGTGPGALTRVIASRVKTVTTYEIDNTLEPILQTAFVDIDNVMLVMNDILKVTDFPNTFKLVANIPYYITTPIILKFLYDPRCTEINILVQDDVARRIGANVGTSDYGALSVTVQAHATAKIIKTAPRGLFRPAPKVDSAFVTIKKNNRGKELDTTFDKVVKGLFMARRKTVANGLKQLGYINAVDILKDCGIDNTIRPENMTVVQFVNLSDYISKLDKSTAQS